jgi:ATP-dependent DNA helicase PIF1
MATNKSQGQSLKHVGLYTPHSVFSHDQLYVDVSRVTSGDGLKILLGDDEGVNLNTITNIVYKEVFCNL